MKKAPPVNHADAAAFHDRTRAAGLYRKGCGLAAVEMARRLRAAPVALVSFRRANGHTIRVIPNNENGAMGALVKNKLARFCAEGAFYELTPDGAAWLAGVEPLA